MIRRIFVCANVIRILYTAKTTSASFNIAEFIRRSCSNHNQKDNNKWNTHTFLVYTICISYIQDKALQSNIDLQWMCFFFFFLTAHFKAGLCSTEYIDFIAETEFKIWNFILFLIYKWSTQHFCIFHWYFIKQRSSVILSIFQKHLNQLLTIFLLKFLMILLHTYEKRIISIRVFFSNLHLNSIMECWLIIKWKWKTAITGCVHYEKKIIKNWTANIGILLSYCNDSKIEL